MLIKSDYQNYFNDIFTVSCWMFSHPRFFVFNHPVMNSLFSTPCIKSYLKFLLFLSVFLISLHAYIFIFICSLVQKLTWIYYGMYKKFVKSIFIFTICYYFLVNWNINFNIFKCRFCINTKILFFFKSFRGVFMY